MPKALSPQQKATVTTMLAARAPQKDIAEAASCSVSQVKRMAKNIRKWGRPVAPKLVPQGRPRALAQDVVEGLVEYFRQHPFAPLGELVTFINETYHVSTTKSTISRVLKRANMDRSTLQTEAKDQGVIPIPVELGSNSSLPMTVLVSQPT